MPFKMLLLDVLTRIRDVRGSISAVPPVILTEIFGCFPQFLQENAITEPRLDHDCFLPNYFQFIVHESRYN
jgi:hypothetical protein